MRSEDRRGLIASLEARIEAAHAAERACCENANQRRGVTLRVTAMLRVASVLTFAADEHGVASIRVRELLRRVGGSRANLFRTLRGLEAIGLLERRHDFHQDTGEQKCSHYALSLAPSVAAPILVATPILSTVSVSTILAESFPSIAASVVAEFETSLAPLAEAGVTKTRQIVETAAATGKRAGWVINALRSEAAAASTLTRVSPHPKSTYGSTEHFDEANANFERLTTVAVESNRPDPDAEYNKKLDRFLLQTGSAD